MEELSGTVLLPETEIPVNQENGEFEFQIQIPESEAYAGMEFGLVCGPECEITAIAYDREVSSTGPADSDMTWFGFFDGEDSFTESMTVTVSGVCRTGTDSVIALKKVKKYTIGENEYMEEEFPVDVNINLREQIQETMVKQESGPAKSEVSISWPMLLCVAGIVVIAGVLIYIGLRSKKRGENV